MTPGVFGGISGGVGGGEIGVRGVIFWWDWRDWRIVIVRNEK